MHDGFPLAYDLGDNAFELGAVPSVEEGFALGFVAIGFGVEYDFIVFDFDGGFAVVFDDLE